MKRIESRTNPLYRKWKMLLSSSGIKEHQSILVSGRKLVPEFLTMPEARFQSLIISDPKDVELIKFPRSLEVTWLKRELFDELDEAGTHFPLLVVEAPSLPITRLNQDAKNLEVMLALSNPLNMGAALRSCEAFQVSKVILLKECANPFLPKVLRSSSGSSLRICLELGPSIKELTPTESQSMWALDMESEDISRVAWPKNVRLFIGEEGKGVPTDLNFSKRVSIPIKPGMDSLNALAATSIALYQYRLRHPVK